MEILGRSIGSILKRPFIIIFWGIIMLMFTAAGYYLPVFRIIYKLGAISGSSPTESIMSFIQLLYSYLSDAKLIFIIIFVYLVLLLLVSLISGLLLSGYIYVVHNTVNKKQKPKAEFLTGIKKYFSKTWLITFIILLSGSLLIIVMAISTVPALVITGTFINKGDNILPAILFVDVLTCVVLFFGLMFFRIYTLFLYPSLVSSREKYFFNAKQLVDENFWSILLAMLVFDVVFIGFQALFLNLGNNIFVLFVKWIFLTVFYALFSTYIFCAYNKYSESSAS